MPESKTGPLSRDVVRLMLMMRRLVKEEFQVTVHLDEPDAADTLIGFASHAGDARMHALARELDAALGSDGRRAASESSTDRGSASAPGGITRMYRGHPVR